jgi:uncharacterized protein YgiM (DUF1202 family)
MIGRLVLLLAASLTAVGPAHAQFGDFGKRLLERTKETVGKALSMEGGAPCLTAASAADETSECLQAAFTTTIASSFGRMLRGEALELHQGAVLSALMSGEDTSWTAGEGEASGEVKVVESGQSAAPVDISMDSSRAQPPQGAFELVGKDYHATGNVHVRKGPGTNHPVTGALAAGETITVIGKLQHEDWYLIGRDGVATGYVYGKNLAEGAAEPRGRAETASDAPVETATVDANRTCRTVEQVVKDKKGREKTETIRACMGPNGWELA